MSASTERKNIKVLVFPEGDYYVAQCLEYDIAVQARTMSKLKERLEETLSAYVILAKEHGDEPFSNLESAPADYWRQWDSAVHSFQNFILKWPELDWIDETKIPQEAEMALA